MRRLWLIGLVAVLILVPAALWAAQRAGRARVDTQSFAWTTETQTTTASDWQTIEGLRAEGACARGGATVDVTLQLAGGAGPVDLRVFMADLSVAGEGRAMRPGYLTVDTGERGRQGPETASLTFVTKDVPGIHGSEFRVQWRSPAGEPVSFQRGSMRVLWNAPDACL